MTAIAMAGPRKKLRDRGIIDSSSLFFYSEITCDTLKPGCYRAGCLGVEAFVSFCDLLPAKVAAGADGQRKRLEMPRA
jgi:hypothetical protein